MKTYSRDDNVPSCSILRITIVGSLYLMTTIKADVIAGAAQEQQWAAEWDGARTEDELLRIARLKLRVDVSTLIAHDLGNQLTVIQNAAQMLQENAQLEGNRQQQDKTMVELVLSSSRWALSLSRQLQGLAHEEEDEPCPVDCSYLVREQAAMLGSVLGGAITLDFELSPEPVHIAIAARSLREVLLNLALNARDAMPQGGVFHISTERAAAPERTGTKAVECAHITVRDTGQGMDEQTRLSAFQPYFTRKRKSSNSGLGLASVERTLHRANGSIFIESAPGKGTRFDIYLPWCEDAVSPVPA